MPGVHRAFCDVALPTQKSLRAFNPTTLTDAQRTEHRNDSLLQSYENAKIAVGNMMLVNDKRSFTDYDNALETLEPDDKVLFETFDELSIAQLRIKAYEAERGNDDRLVSLRANIVRKLKALNPDFGKESEQGVFTEEEDYESEYERLNQLAALTEDDAARLQIITNVRELRAQLKTLVESDRSLKLAKAIDCLVNKKLVEKRQENEDFPRIENEGLDELASSALSAVINLTHCFYDDLSPLNNIASKEMKSSYAVNYYQIQNGKKCCFLLSNAGYHLEEFIAENMRGICYTDSGPAEEDSTESDDWCGFRKRIIVGTKSYARFMELRGEKYIAMQENFQAECTDLKNAAPPNPPTYYSSNVHFALQRFYSLDKEIEILKTFYEALYAELEGKTRTRVFIRGEKQGETINIGHELKTWWSLCLKLYSALRVMFFVDVCDELSLCYITAGNKETEEKQNLLDMAIDYSWWDITTSMSTEKEVPVFCQEAQVATLDVAGEMFNKYYASLFQKVLKDEPLPILLQAWSSLPLNDETNTGVLQKMNIEFAANPRNFFTEQRGVQWLVKEGNEQHIADWEFEKRFYQMTECVLFQIIMLLDEVGNINVSSSAFEDDLSDTDTDTEEEFEVEEGITPIMVPNTDEDREASLKLLLDSREASLKLLLGSLENEPMFTGVKQMVRNPALELETFEIPQKIWLAMCAEMAFRDRTIIDIEDKLTSTKRACSTVTDVLGVVQNAYEKLESSLHSSLQGDYNTIVTEWEGAFFAPNKHLESEWKGLQRQSVVSIFDFLAGVDEETHNTRMRTILLETNPLTVDMVNVAVSRNLVPDDPDDSSKSAFSLIKGITRPNQTLRGKVADMLMHDDVSSNDPALLTELTFDEALKRCEKQYNGLSLADVKSIFKTRPEFIEVQTTNNDLSEEQIISHIIASHFGEDYEDVESRNAIKFMTVVFQNVNLTEQKIYARLEESQLPLVKQMNPEDILFLIRILCNLEKDEAYDFANYKDALRPYQNINVNENTIIEALHLSDRRAQIIALLAKDDNDQEKTEFLLHYDELVVENPEHYQREYFKETNAPIQNMIRVRAQLAAEESEHSDSDDDDDEHTTEKDIIINEALATFFATKDFEKNRQADLKKNEVNWEWLTDEENSWLKNDWRAWAVETKQTSAQTVATSILQKSYCYAGGQEYPHPACGQIANKLCRDGIIGMTLTPLENGLATFMLSELTINIGVARDKPVIRQLVNAANHQELYTQISEMKNVVVPDCLWCGILGLADTCVRKREELEAEYDEINDQADAKHDEADAKQRRQTRQSIKNEQTEFCKQLLSSSLMPSQYWGLGEADDKQSKETILTASILAYVDTISNERKINDKGGPKAKPPIITLATDFISDLASELHLKILEIRGPTDRSLLERKAVESIRHAGSADLSRTGAQWLQAKKREWSARLRVRRKLRIYPDFGPASNMLDGNAETLIAQIFGAADDVQDLWQRVFQRGLDDYGGDVEMAQKRVKGFIILACIDALDSIRNGIDDPGDQEIVHIRAIIEYLENQELFRNGVNVDLLLLPFYDDDGAKAYAEYKLKTMAYDFSESALYGVDQTLSSDSTSSDSDSDDSTSSDSDSDDSMNSDSDNDDLLNTSVTSRKSDGALGQDERFSPEPLESSDDESIIENQASLLFAGTPQSTTEPTRQRDFSIALGRCTSSTELVQETIVTLAFRAHSDLRLVSVPPAYKIIDSPIPDLQESLIQGYLTTKSIDTSALLKRKRLERKRSNDDDPGPKKSRPRQAGKTLKRPNSVENGAAPKKPRERESMQQTMNVDQRLESTGGATIVVFSENYESAKSDMEIKISANSLIVPARRRMQNTSMALKSEFTRANEVFFSNGNTLIDLFLKQLKVVGQKLEALAVVKFEKQTKGSSSKMSEGPDDKDLDLPTDLFEKAFRVWPVVCRDFGLELMVSFQGVGEFPLTTAHEQWRAYLRSYGKRMRLKAEQGLSLAAKVIARLILNGVLKGETFEDFFAQCGGIEFAAQHKARSIALAESLYGTVTANCAQFVYGHIDSVHRDDFEELGALTSPEWAKEKSELLYSKAAKVMSDLMHDSIGTKIEVFLDVCDETNLWRAHQALQAKELAKSLYGKLKRGLDGFDYAFRNLELQDDFEALGKLVNPQSEPMVE